MCLEMRLIRSGFNPFWLAKNRLDNQLLNVTVYHGLLLITGCERIVIEIDNGASEEVKIVLNFGYYRNSDNWRSRLLMGRCLEISPDWRQALQLKKTIEDRLAKDRMIGIGIIATGVEVISWWH
ncbi:hypothetical protein QQ045_009976 [Rhodiola kirilowii]